MKQFMLLFGLLIPFLASADEYPDSLSRLSIEGGPNYGYFIDAENSAITGGFTTGLRYDCYISRKMILSLSFYYSKEGADIANVHAMAGYLKFPLYYGYPLYLRNHKEITVYGGPAFMLPVKDYTKTNYGAAAPAGNSSDITYRDVCDEVSGECPEYGSFEIGDNKNVSLDIGFLFKRKQLMVDLSFNYHLLTFGEFGYYKNINRHLLSVKILLGLFFR